MHEVDRVQLHGWTAEIAAQAITRMGAIVARHYAEARTVEDELALELVRWLACAVRDDPDRFVDLLEDLRPSGDDASPWERLESQLAREPDVASLTSRLVAQESHLAQRLCLLLSARVATDADHASLDNTHARAVEILVRLGVDSGIDYLLSNIGLLCHWQSDTPLEELIEPHRDAFAAAALKVWPALCWPHRVTLLLLMLEHDIDADGVVAMLQTVNGLDLTYDDRYDLVEGLLVLDPDQRGADAVRTLIVQCADDPSEEARAFVSHAMERLVEDEQDARDARDVRTAAATRGATRG